MARRPNSYYRDPAFAAAFDNIAQMFAPPSGADAAGFASAALNRQKQQQLADFYKMATDPNASRDVVDRYGIGAGVFNPTQSYYKIGVDDTTTRRGQDVTARTSRENNIRDNSQRMAQARYGALSEGQILPAMPGSVAAMYGLSEQPDVVSGAMKLNQGQDAILPGGDRVEGPRKPLNESEMRAAIIGGLPVQAQQDVATGQQTPVVAMVDGKPAYVAPGTAARMNLPAAAAPSATPVKRDTGTAFINGQQVPVTRDPAGLQWQLPDGTPVPREAKVTNMATPQGSLEQVGATTANNTTANSLAASIVATEDLLGQYEGILRKNPGIIGLPGAIRGTAQDAVSTITELGAAFGNMAPDAKITLDQVQSLAQRVAPARDPNIQFARSLAMSLAYQDAQLQNPSGEVSRQAFERSYEKLTGGMLRNNQSALESVQAMRMLLDAKRKQVGALRSPGSQQPGTPPPGGVERWERGPDGQLRKVQ